MTVGEFILQAKERLAAAKLQCADPLLHAKQLAEYGLDLKTSRLYLAWDDPLSIEQKTWLEALLARRVSGEPFQYITGREWFWESCFKVGPGVLIPRKETEMLVELMLQEPAVPALRVAELGAGSGNIGISVLQERPDWEWNAFELNPESVPYAKANRQALLPKEARYYLREGDFFDGVGALAPFDAIVANPPYVEAEVMAHLSREVKHEPTLALDGGPSGLDVLRALAQRARDWLEPGGRLLCEIGSPQGEAVRAMLEKSGWTDVEIRLDYAGHPRVALARTMP